ncbi:MAG TPA: hypothetical protein DEZ08_06255 [Dehalococcoidia bacterium]|jgi:ABC-2 type transport system permease protein|nr:hypothetical protein [Dehalococcoidia bacterium]
MRGLRAIILKEIQFFFTSPTGYIVGMIFLLGTGVFFTIDMGSPFPEASLTKFFVGIDFGASTFGGITLILILISPILTMRLISEEQKLGTIELLLTSPVRDWEIILGKFIASFIFLMFMIAMTAYYPILLFIFGDPDPGPIYSGYLGIILYGTLTLSIGLLTSTLTSNQIVAAVVAMGTLLILYFADYASTMVTGFWATLIQELGIKSHFDDFHKGIIDSHDVVYFLSITILFVFLSIRILESRRWR